MSFWSRLGLSIGDLTVFQNMCQRHGVEYIANPDQNFTMQGGRVVATLRDTRGGGGYSRDAYIIALQGSHKLVWDNDQNYSTLSRRLGQNGGDLTRDYTTEVIRNESVANGGFIMSQEMEADGSVLLRVGVM